MKIVLYAYISYNKVEINHLISAKIHELNFDFKQNTYFRKKGVILMIVR